MKKTSFLGEVHRLQKIAGILKESRTPGLEKFLQLVAKGIFTAGMEDPMIGDITDWETLFDYWDEFGTLPQYTKSDILHLTKKAGLTPEEVDYIMDLPQVSQLEGGDIEEKKN